MDKDKKLYQTFYKKYFYFGKINILFLPLIFGIIFFSYSHKNIDRYYTAVWLTKTAPIFENYFNKFSKDSLNLGEARNNFEYLFITRLTSIKNFKKFISEYKKQSLSKEKKNIIINSFSDFLYDSNNFKLKNAYNLDFYELKVEHSNDTDGLELLNSYVQYTIKELLFYFINLSELNTVEKINSTENSLEILDGNYLLNSSINNLINENLEMSSADKENLILVFNTDLLNKKLRLYKKDLDELQNLYNDQKLKQKSILEGDNTFTDDEKNKFFEWDPILKIENDTKRVNHLNHFIKGIIFGFLIYFVLIFFKIIVRTKLIS